MHPSERFYIFLYQKKNVLTIHTTYLVVYNNDRFKVTQNHYVGLKYFRFSTKEAATHAIVAIHNSEINAQPVKCSWGKESGDPNNAPSIASQALGQAGFPFGTAYGQQVAGYWYPPAPTYPAAPAPSAPLQGQFLQGMQGYTYGQFAGYQQGYMG